MRRVMAEYQESGQSRRAFCEQRGIALTTFDYWRRELAAKPAQRTKLVPVQVAPAEARFALVLGNGRRIECASETDLARLIRVAERA